MFERYTERARRVLFFARYEASQLGNISIETEHLLLGLIREGKGLTSRIFARSHLSLENIRKEIEGRTVFREKVSTSVEIPFSAETKRVLQFAAEEADRLLHNYIGTEHLLLGILREERSVAASILMEKGMRLHTVREDIVQLLNEKTTLTRAGTADDESLSAPFSPWVRGPQRPNFLPSYDVHIMYSPTAGTARVGSAREWSLCGFTSKAAIAAMWKTDESRIELPPALATDQRYDIVVKLPRDEPREAIHTLVRQAIEKQFGVQVTPEDRSTDVYVLTAPQGAGPALRSQPESQGGAGFVVGFSTTGEHQHGMLAFPMDGFSLSGMPVAIVVQIIEGILDRPVVDETGLTGIYDLELRGSLEDRDAFIRSLRDEAGLIATPGRRDIQVLVVRSQHEDHEDHEGHEADPQGPT
jgi:uncharacterized protein (TIGR03435 family)